MLKSTEYCDLTCTWHCDHDPEFLSSYSCIQNSETNDWNVELQSDTILKQTPVVCSRDSESEVLEISCTCRPQHGMVMLGFNIVSEAKTIEVYSHLDGYLCTVRGYKLQLDDSQVTDVSKPPVLFCCEGKLNSATDNIELRFLGIRDKQTVKIYRLHFYLNQTDTPSHCTHNGSGPGMIDMEKVKGYLHGMGHTAPENGTKLLHAVEDFQQSQMSKFGGLQGIGNNMGLLSSLLSAVCRPSNDSDTKLNHAKPDYSYSKPESSESNNDKVEPPVSSGSGALSAMLMSMQQNQSQGHSSGQGQDQMFSMLQNICGKVGKLRVSEHDNSPEAVEKQNNTSRQRNNVPEERKSENKNTPGQLSTAIPMMQTFLTQTVTQMFEKSEQNLQAYIDTRLTAMESRLSEKLDNLMALLQSGNHQPTSGTYSDDHTNTDPTTIDSSTSVDVEGSQS